MKYFKLLIISIIVFAVMFFFMSLLFPSTTYISRAMNVAGNQNTVRSSLPQLFAIGFDKASQQSIVIKDYIPSADTLHFYVETQVSGGMAVYAMGKDSTTLQLFYQINVPWYKPWQKLALMINEEKYGPSLDTAISRLQQVIR